MLRTAFLSLAPLLAVAACGRGGPESPAPDANTPVVSASVTTNPADRSRTWTWNQSIRRGTCVMDGATLTLHEDGTYVFHALVQSSDRNDRWDVSFSFLDRDRVLLEGINTATSSYTMENANQRYRWVTSRTTDSNMPMDANPNRGARLSDIGSVNIHAGC